MSFKNLIRIHCCHTFNNQHNEHIYLSIYIEREREREGEKEREKKKKGGGLGVLHPLKQGYTICWIYKKVQIVKNLSETALNKVYRVPA